MVSQDLINAVNGYENYISVHGIDENVIDAYIMAAETAINVEKDLVYGLELTKRVKEIIEKYVMDLTGGTVWDLEKYSQDNDVQISLIEQYYSVLKMESYELFESFIFYMEKLRHYKKRFYQPRRKTLKVVVQDLMDLDAGKYKFYGLSMPSRVGKSTICIFFFAWVAMKRPNSHNAMGGHSGILAKGFYKELLNLMTTPEYTFSEIFSYWHPKSTVIRDKSAEDFTITLDDPDRFATITCRGIDGTWIGAVDVSKDGYLYVDDLVRDREHSLSPTRMESTFQEYLNKMVDRKNDGAKELMVGTLWNVLDPLERIRKTNEGNSDYKFRKIPALDENDESNFAYEINGFSTEYYRNMRERLDKPEWEAKFMQRPFVREGLLFPDDELRFYNGILPEGGFVRNVSVVDVAWGSGDSLSMPIGAEFENGDVFIYDWVFNKGKKEDTLPIVAGKIIGNKIQQINFEGNNGGNMYRMYIDEKLQASNYPCSTTDTKAPNKIAKMQKIIQYSGDVKRRFVFLEPKKRSKEYQDAMDELTMFVTIGNNEHDDAADSLSQLSMFINGMFVATVQAIQNPMWGGMMQ